MYSLRKISTRLCFTNICTSSARFAPCFVRQPNGPKCTKIVQTHQNMCLGSNGVDRVRSLRKIPTRPRGTNFCTSSARFAPSFVSNQTVPKAPNLYETHRKIPKRLRGTNFCTSSARFAPRFVTQPNGPRCPKIIRNAPKHEFMVQWDGSDAFVSKNFDATSCHELLYQFGPFCTEFRKSTKRSLMHQNCTKRTKT